MAKQPIGRHNKNVSETMKSSKRTDLQNNRDSKVAVGLSVVAGGLVVAGVLVMTLNVWGGIQQSLVNSIGFTAGKAVSDVEKLTIHQDAVNEMSEAIETIAEESHEILQNENPIPKGVFAAINTGELVKTNDGRWCYLIQEGDTLTSISAKFGYSVDDIGNLNGIRDLNKINKGATLLIPF